MQAPQTKISWFLGTGPKEYYYTLWSQTVIPGTGCFYSYRTNLAHDYNEAVAKATARTGQTVWEAFDISGYRQMNSGAPDLNLAASEVMMTFGKYNGQTVEYVADKDLRYLLFLAHKSDWAPTQTAHKRCLNYIKAFFKPMAEQAEADRNAARAARDAQRADLPAFEGRVTITGTVISTKVVDSQFGSSVKMLVEHKDGWKIWGTIPSAIQFINEVRGNHCGQRALERGDVVRFDAVVEKSDRDPKFGFFRRATKAQLVKPFEGELVPVAKGEYPKVEVVIEDALEPLPTPHQDQVWNAA